MPIYEYECGACGCVEDFVNAIDDRRTKAPLCTCNDEQMNLVISPVVGRVKFPAAGGHEYVSPTTGRVIGTEKARRDDLARSGCRPYEGREQEAKEAAKVRAHEEKKSDAKLHESVSKAYHQLPPDKRRVLETT